MNDAAGVDVVGGKLADLTLSAVPPPTPGQVGPSGGPVEPVQKVRLDGGPWRGRHGMAMRLWVRKQLSWQLVHEIGRLGGSEVCNDEFWSVVEGGVGA